MVSIFVNTLQKLTRIYASALCIRQPILINLISNIIRQQILINECVETFYGE